MSGRERDVFTLDDSSFSAPTWQWRDARAWQIQLKRRLKRLVFVSAAWDVPGRRRPSFSLNFGAFCREFFGVFLRHGLFRAWLRQSWTSDAPSPSVDRAELNGTNSRWRTPKCSFLWFFLWKSVVFCALQVLEFPEKGESAKICVLGFLFHLSSIPLESAPCVEKAFWPARYGGGWACTKPICPAMISRIAWLKASCKGPQVQDLAALSSLSGSSSSP